VKRYDELLQVVRECDYRVLEAPGCGCQAAQARCLMARGGAHWDRYEVNPHDCLECTKKEENDGRVVAEDSEASEGDDGDEDDHLRAPGADRGDGAAKRQLVVPVNEGPVEREVLRLERELQQLWFDIRNIQNFRGPPIEQGLASLFNTLKNLGGGGFHPGSFGCDGGMPATLNWSDPVFGNGTLTYSAATNCYSSGPTLVNVPPACDGSCPGANNVPMQVNYCPDGVTTSFKCDGSGCPTSGSITDSMGCNFGWPAPTILICDTVTPSNTTSNPTSPNDVSNGSPANKMGYCPPNDVASFGPGKPGASECPTIPRTVYLKSATYGLFTLIYSDADSQWESLTKVINVPANVNGSGCPARSVHVRVFRNPLSPPGTPSIQCKHIGICADDSGVGPSLVDNWFTYIKDSCNPYRAHGAGGGSGSVIPNVDTYTIN
jgi:hypothetical protein